MAAKGVWMAGYLIGSLQYMPNVLIQVEKLMIWTEMIENENTKALAMVQ